MRASEDQLKAWMIGGLDGDAKCAAALLRALAPLLRVFFKRWVRDDDDIEDLVQDTLVAIHTRRDSYDRKRPFTPWLFSIARYKMIDYFRRARATCPIDEIDRLLSDESFEAASNASMDIKRLLETLPAKQADAIRRTRLEGLSVSEAATAGGIGESDVKVSVHRGLKALAARLRGERR